MKCDYKAIGRRIALACQSKNFSQATLADQLFISTSHISKIEVGNRMPSIDLLYAISEATGASLDYLVAGRKEREVFKDAVQEAITILTDLVKQT